MKKSKCPLFVLLLFILIVFYFPIYAQHEYRISGKVTDQKTGKPIPGVNIIVKGLIIGTITDEDGNYSLTVKEPLPQVLQFSFVGHETVTREITTNMLNNNATITDFDIRMADQVILGKEIVVSASRYEETIMESPVTIEKMDILAIRNTAANSYYKALANLKGIDIAHSSINFQILNARGFSSTGNVRFVQLVDGMDTQAPGLNFPIGNLNGPSVLDIESVELIPGASSALYGPNAFNGLILINSKDPFNYQGLSAMAKIGVNHIDEDYVSASPVYEGAIRYARAFKNKLAFKVNLAYMRGEDWWGRNFDDKTPERQGALSFNPGSDIVHKQGDEAGINLAVFPLNPDWRALARIYGLFEQGLSAETYALAGDLPSTTVTLNPYEEQNIVDYGAENLKINGSFHYRLTNKIEALYAFNWGYGTSVYTGAQRYSLDNFKIAQHKIEVKGDNFSGRIYATLENSGDSYIAEFLALKINDYWIREKWKGIIPDAGVPIWLGGYGVDYLRYLYQIGLQPGDINTMSNTQLLETYGKDRIGIEEDAHIFARNLANQGRYLPGTPGFDTARESGLSEVIPQGATFSDKSNMIQAEGFYNFKHEIDIMDLQAGLMFRQFNLRSNGTIFDDIGGLIVREFGGFIQAGKSIFKNKLRLQGSIRYDQNENFNGLISPRFSAVYQILKNQNIRFALQSGFRNPTIQNQHIDLNVVSRRLLGGLPKYPAKYMVDQNSFTLSSVEAYTKSILDAGANQEALLDEDLKNILEASQPYRPVKPEQIKSLEVGYKGLIAGQFLIDGVFFYNIYNGLIGAYRVRKANGNIDDPDPDIRIGARASLLSGTADNTFDLANNFTKNISAFGVAIGLNYSFPEGFLLGFNWNMNVLDQQTQDKNPDFQFAFNTPKNKINLQFGNRSLTDKLGFNISYRWQSAFKWESTFAIGPVDEVSTIDAQISCKLSQLSSIIKLGADNLLNSPYIMNYGGPEMGAIYYVSLTFDEFLQ